MLLRTNFELKELSRTIICDLFPLPLIKHAVIKLHRIKFSFTWNKVPVENFLNDHRQGNCTLKTFSIRCSFLFNIQPVLFFFWDTRACF